MKTYTLITGASTGIGAEMARILAAQKFNLVLVARSLDKLAALVAELRAAHGIEIIVAAKDLSKSGNAIALYNELKNQQIVVEMLINNAGVGNYGDFVQTDLDEDLAMIDLNITSLMVLTKLYAQEMVARKSGKIQNVASIVSFLPFPYYTVYSATKAFVLAFSETLAAELEGTGVVVTALCPGTVETPFHTPEMRKTNGMMVSKPMSAKDVAQAGVDLLLHGKGKKIPGFMNWFFTNLPRIMPDFLMMKIKKSVSSQQS
jgi:uncharacterized protein